MPTSFLTNRIRIPYVWDSTIFFRLLFAVFFVLLLLETEGVCENRLTFGEKRTVIVIDPGHGGRDTGAVGPAGAMEKTVSLNLAEAVAGFLSEKYDVILTRTGNYNVPIYERTAVANGNHAVIFLSLHTAAGPVLSSSGMHCWFNEPVEPDGGGTADEKPATGENVPWNRIQDRHWKASRQLAETLAKALGKQMKPKTVRAMAARLPLLQGADMPAILLETGSITNPAEETALADPAHIKKIAGVIAIAIDGFVQRRPKGDSRRLQ